MDASEATQRRAWSLQSFTHYGMLSRAIPAQRVGAEAPPTVQGSSATGGPALVLPITPHAFGAHQPICIKPDGASAHQVQQMRPVWEGLQSRRDELKAPRLRPFCIGCLGGHQRRAWSLPSSTHYGMLSRAIPAQRVGAEAPPTVQGPSATGGPALVLRSLRMHSVHIRRPACTVMANRLARLRITRRSDGDTASARCKNPERNLSTTRRDAAVMVAAQGEALRRSAALP
ncbi:hypothetical protein NB723_002703 [Xanthomonas sacchari]|nr:hypothetical protein [Xanthomonas sacchari]